MSVHAAFRAEHPMPTEHIHFVTGRLAERSLREVVDAVARVADFEYTIDVLPITVAALMTPEWIARHVFGSRGRESRFDARLLRGRLDAD